MSLLSKPLDSVSREDLDALVANGVGENLYLEYKVKLSRDDKAVEGLLGSVVAFANAFGGDIVIGVSAESGLPREIVGISNSETDDALLRVNQLIHTRVEPVCWIQTNCVPVSPNTSALVIRIPRSWNPPHGIRQNKGHLKFYMRHSSGKLPMSVSDLRSAFLARPAIVDTARSFRKNRIALRSEPGSSAWAGRPTGPEIMLHVVPFSSLVEGWRIDLSRLSTRDLYCLAPGRPSDSMYDFVRKNTRYKVDGVVISEPGGKWRTHLFRDGSVELYSKEYFKEHDDRLYLDGFEFQVFLLNFIGSLIGFLQENRITPPLCVMVSILHAKNVFLRLDNSPESGGNYEDYSPSLSDYCIDRGEVILPDIAIEDLSKPLRTTLSPLFDALWNAAGEQRCTFYDLDGNWEIDQSHMWKS